MRHLLRLLQYDAWANREILGSLQSAEPPPRSLKWMAHIIGAEWLWLSRLGGEPAVTGVWPELGVEECGEHLAKLSRAWPESLYMHQDSLEKQVSYTNSKGEAWTSTVEDILTHVTVHSAYHRGQIAADLRAAGIPPAYTDYIHATRNGYLR